MCGIQSPRPSQPLGGALAVLNAPTSSAPSTRLQALSGHMVFHALPQDDASSSTSRSSNMATHITYTPSSLVDAAGHDLSGCVIGIHSTGDLRTRSSASSSTTSDSEDSEEEDQEEMSLLHRLDFSAARPSVIRTRSTELRLEEPLEIGVGGSGIIGRKVSVWRNSGNGRGVRIAEGIVGFN